MKEWNRIPLEKPCTGLQLSLSYVGFPLELASFFASRLQFTHSNKLHEGRRVLGNMGQRMKRATMKKDSEALENGPVKQILEKNFTLGIGSKKSE